MKDLINIPGIGPVLLIGSVRSSRITIRVKAYKGVEITYPLGTSEREISQFLQKYHQWMIEALEKVKAKEEKQTVFDETTEFRTRSFALKIESASRTDVQLKLQNGCLLVRYPMHQQVTSAPIQEIIRYGIVEALRRDAKVYLPLRMLELAIQHGFRYKGVSIKNMKSRWGSCSGTQNINLNLHLMRLPDHLIDYVLLHELCHTKVMNHGKEFKELLHSVTDGKVLELEAEIKEHRTVIY